MKTKLSALYETDFNLWIEQTINHLKQRNLTKCCGIPLLQGGDE
ncbi:DUF29 domain-containing protein [Spirulina subsalsa FACHB-351]|uniref:DUF29 domain-containing protein n=1 Tax=Spirulina subsalsa FACHB-351 TaxID=234711 RepID=A0ABT3L819_9CYAN|nr:DUF29 domain-containing protein [Spirulina subsalsa FACHB-351]